MIMKIEDIKCVLKTSRIVMPFGAVMAIGDDEAVYLLIVEKHRNAEPRITRLQRDIGALVVWGKADPLIMLEKELRGYFSRTLKEFKTPIKLCGTPFEQAVWKELCTIPYGQTRSYAEIAAAIGNPSEIHKVAQATIINPLWFIVPCHRAINANREFEEYDRGLSRRRWVLDHEQKE
jgi:AraC family transcriptional regulator of adaptative response/methylated-DNA-[protein]-cysteine methyltransferase